MINKWKQKKWKIKTIINKETMEEITTKEATEEREKRELINVLILGSILNSK